MLGLQVILNIRHKPLCILVKHPHVELQAYHEDILFGEVGIGGWTQDPHTPILPAAKFKCGFQKTTFIYSHTTQNTPNLIYS